jgi:hypothetical protein
MTRIEQIQQALARARAAGDNEAAAEIEFLLAREQGEQALRVNAANPSSVNLTQEQIDERQREAVRRAEAANRAAPLPATPPSADETTIGSLAEAGGAGILDQLQQAGSFIGATVVDPVQNAIEWAEAGLVGREPRYRNRLEESRQISENLRQGLGEMSTAEQVAFGAGSAAGMIPETLVGGGLIRQGTRAGTALLNEGAETAAEFALRQTREGAAATSLLAPRLGAQTSAEAEAAGATPLEATVAGAADTLGTMLTAGLPISARGGLAKRTATGAVGGVAAEAGVQGAVNPLLPEELAAQRDLTDPTNLTTAAGLGALMGAAFGTRPAPKLSDAARDLAAMRDAEVARGIESAQELPAVAQAERAIAELMSNLPEGGLDLETRRGEASTLLDTTPVIEEPAGPSSPFLPRSDRVNLEARQGEASTLLDVPTEVVAEPQGPVSVLPGVRPQEALALDTPRGEASPIEGPEATRMRFEAQRVDAEEQTAFLQNEKQTLLQNPTRENRVRVKEIDRELGRQAIRRAVAVNALSNPPSVQSAPVEAPAPELPLTRQARVSTLDEARSLSQPIQQPEATTPAPLPQTAPTAPLTRAERVAQRTVAEQVLNPETGQMETVVEAAISPEDTRRKGIEDFFSGATTEQTAAVRQDQAAGLTNRSVDPRLEAAAAAIANRTVPPEQRRVTPLRAALGRAKTAWDALAGVRAAVARGENPNIERYDRLIQVLSTEDMKDVEFKLLQPETEATTEAQRRVKEGIGIDKYTKGLHEVDNATGKQSVVITGDGYAGRDGTKSVETTLHEIVHAKGTKAIREVLNGTEKDERIVKAVKNYENIRKEVRKADRKDLTRDEAEAVDYATENLYEFHSGAMTNPLVQSAMKKEGFFKRWVNTIRVLIGVPRSQKSALDEVLDAAYAIVDAVNTVNAERPSPQNQTNTSAFKRWFDGSSIVNDDGSPRVVYHGTRADFSEFRPGNGSYGTGIYMTPSREFAGATYGAGEGGLVMPLYASVKSPYVVEASSKERSILNDLSPKEMTDKLKRLGFDGVVVELNGEVQTVVAFDPEQVKSATGNQGSFDPTSPDIRRSASRQNNNPDVAQARKQVLGEDTSLLTRQIQKRTSPFSTTGHYARKFDYYLSRLFSSKRGATKSTAEAMSYLGGVKERMDAEVTPAINRLRDTLRALKGRPNFQAIVDDVNKVLKGEMKIEDSKVILPEIRERVTDSVKEGRRVIDKFSMEIGNEVARSYEGRDMPESVVSKLETIKSQIGKYVSRTYMSDLKKKYADEVWNNFTKGVPEAVATVQPLLNRLTKEITELPSVLEAARQEAADLSSGRAQFSPEDTFTGNQLRRMYENYIGSSQGRTKQDMIEALDKFSKAADKDIGAEARRVVQEIMGVGKGVSSLAQYYRGLRSNDNPLKSRSSIPEEILKVWGEVGDPILNLVNTSQRMATLLSGLKASNLLAETTPEAFSDKYDADSGKTSQIPNNPVAYGQLAGKYTDEGTFGLIAGQMEMGTALLFGKPIDPGRLGRRGGELTLNTLAAITRYQKLMGIVTNLYTFLSNATNMVAFPLINGNFSPKNSATAAKVAGKLVGSGFRSDKTDPLVLEVLEMGIIDPVLTQAQDVINQRTKEARAMRRFRVLGDVGTSTKSFFTNIWDTGLEGSAVLETFPKIWNYLNAKETMRKIYPDLSETDIKRLAAEETNRLNLTYARVPEIVKATETLGVSYVAGYMQQVLATSWYSASSGARQAIEGIRSGNTELAKYGLKKIAGSSMAYALGTYVLTAAAEAMGWIGEDDDDPDARAFFESLPFLEQGQQPMIVRVEDDGTVIYTDIGRLNPLDSTHSVIRATVQGFVALSKGDAEAAEEAVAGAWSNLSSQFTGGGPVSDVLIRTVQGTPMPRAMENDAKWLHDYIVETMDYLPLIDRDRASNIANASWQLFAPAMAKGPLRQNQLEEANPETFGAPLMALALNVRAPVNIHNPFLNIQQQAEFAYSKDSRVGVESLKEILSSTDDISKDEIKAQIQDVIDAEAEAFNELGTAVRGARYAGRMAGLSESAIRTGIQAALKNGNVREDNARAIAQGTAEFKPLILGDSWGTDAIQTELNRMRGATRAARAERQAQMERRLAEIRQVMAEMQPRRRVSLDNL